MSHCDIIAQGQVCDEVNPLPCGRPGSNGPCIERKLEDRKRQAKAGRQACMDHGLPPDCAIKELQNTKRSEMLCVEQGLPEDCQNLLRNIRVPAFISGYEGYDTFRIPSIIRLVDTGDLLLFAEGRRFSDYDLGWNDIVMKRSTDSGKSWGPLRVLQSQGSDRNEVTMHNPVPIAVNTAPGTVILVYVRGRTTVLISRSVDHGFTWGPSTPLPEAFKDNWFSVNTGPPQGIELARGPKPGRLMFCADHGLPDQTVSFVMYSDDGGHHWNRSESVPSGNECQIAESSDGTLVMNMRTHGTGYDADPTGPRQLSYSHDGGLTWTPPVTWRPSGVDYKGGRCEGSIINHDGSGMLFFSTPLHERTRSNMTVFGSSDHGRHWSVVASVDPGPSAYSALVELNSTHVGLAYEEGGYRSITFVPLLINTKRHAEAKTLGGRVTTPEPFIAGVAATPGKQGHNDNSSFGLTVAFGVAFGMLLLVFAATRILGIARRMSSENSDDEDTGSGSEGEHARKRRGSWNGRNVEFAERSTSMSRETIRLAPPMTWLPVANPHGAYI